MDFSEITREAVMSLSAEPKSGSLLISAISFIALLYAASGLFFQLQYSLNTIWRISVPEKGQTISLIRQRLFAFLLVIGVGLFGVTATFVNLFLSWFGSILERLIGLGGSHILIARLSSPILLLLIIALFYKILPETRVRLE